MDRSRTVTESEVCRRTAVAVMDGHTVYFGVGGRSWWWDRDGGTAIGPTKLDHRDRTFPRLRARTIKRHPHSIGHVPGCTGQHIPRVCPAYLLGASSIDIWDGGGDWSRTRTPRKGRARCAMPWSPSRCSLQVGCWWRRPGLQRARRCSGPRVPTPTHRTSIVLSHESMQICAR